MNTTVQPGLDALQQAFRADPAVFNAFVAGVAAAVAQQTQPEKSLPDAVPTQCSSSIPELPSFRSGPPATTSWLCERSSNASWASAIRPRYSLTAIDRTLIFRYQELAVSEYTQGLTNELAKREAMARTRSRPRAP